MKILIIEDDTQIAAVMHKGLAEFHYDIIVEHDGKAGLDRARSDMFSLIILDIMLPGLDGWSICETLRDERDTTPILMLTARDAVNDRVRGLEIGADDYLPKPFDFAELVARVNALLRRDRGNKSRTIRIDDLAIDTKTRRVERSGHEIALTGREYALLEALATREGQVLSRDVIQERVWMDENSTSNTVDVYIGMLRKKIDAGYAVKLIQTVHGVGYTIRAPQADADQGPLPKSVGGVPVRLGPRLRRHIMPRALPSQVVRFDNHSIRDEERT